MTCSRCHIHASLTVEKLLFAVDVNGRKRYYCGRCKRLFVDLQREDAKFAASRWAWIDSAFERVPPHMRLPLFRALSRVLHPDAGGDPEAMTILNAANERYKRANSHE